MTAVKWVAGAMEFDKVLLKPVVSLQSVAGLGTYSISLVMC
jgi:hypothetical protein